MGQLWNIRKIGVGVHEIFTPPLRNTYIPYMLLFTHKNIIIMKKRWWSNKVLNNAKCPITRAIPNMTCYENPPFFIGYSLQRYTYKICSASCFFHVSVSQCLIIGIQPFRLVLNTWRYYWPNLYLRCHWHRSSIYHWWNWHQLLIHHLKCWHRW